MPFFRGLDELGQGMRRRYGQVENLRTRYGVGSEMSAGTRLPPDWRELAMMRTRNAQWLQREIDRKRLERVRRAYRVIAWVILLTISGTLLGLAINRADDWQRDLDRTRMQERLEHVGDE